MQILAEIRKEHGSSASRRLRRAGRVPAIVYGAGEEPIYVHLDHNQMIHSVKKESFRSAILSLTVDAKEIPVVLQDVQKHTYKQWILHMDFQRIDPNAKLTKRVPIHFVGEENSPAVKLSGSIINHVMATIEISCLPKDLPEFISVDLSGITVGHSIHANDIKYPNGVVPVLHGQNPVLAAAIKPSDESSTDATAAATPAA
jgi:large subunit ribosomal protein L25